MKQIAKSQQVVDRLRAAFGPDVDVSTLPVYEAIALNTLPLRKTSGIFKGARSTPKTLTDMASAVNAESAPMQLVHQDGTTPVGRVFYCEVMGGDEARVLFTISDPKYQADIDNGTINQVSVGMQPAALNCSVCGFDYLGADATMNNLWGLTCNDGHTIGDAATYAVIDGMSSFFELSLVGKAAVIGARIVGPSESRLQGNTQFRLAASARPEGVTGLILTATPKENTLDLTALTAALTAATVDKANAQTQLTAAQTEVTDLKAKIATLEAAAGRIPDLEAAAGHVDAAAAALRTEATTILTACGKQDQVANLAGKNIPGLLEVITAHRAEFAAAVPIGPKSTPAMTKSDTPVGPSHTAAFSARR